MYFGTSIHGDVGKICLPSIHDLPRSTNKAVNHSPPIVPVFFPKKKKKKKTAKEDTCFWGSVFLPDGFVVGFFSSKKTPKPGPVAPSQSKPPRRWTIVVLRPKWQQWNHNMAPPHPPAGRMAHQKKMGFLERFVCKLIQRHPTKKRCEKTSGFCVVLLIFVRRGACGGMFLREILASQVDAHFQNVMSSSVSSKNKDTQKIGPTKKNFGK